MNHAGAYLMAKEDNQKLRCPSLEEAITNGNPPASAQEALERKIFGLALALATEPSKLGQLRQMLVHLQHQREIPEDFSTWAIGHINERVKSMALEYAHDAEVMVQILSFQGGTFASLTQDIEEMYQHEQITQRVYVKAKLLLHGVQTEMPAKSELF
jgi:hypothetical protein